MMVAILCFTLLLCAFRFLSWLSVFKQLGVLLLIINKIFMTDIGPFLVYITIFMGSFEVASFFFSWNMEVEHVFGQYLRMWTGIDKDFLSDEELNKGVLWWDKPREWTYVSFSIFFRTLFFLLTTVILMNLLIAMSKLCSPDASAGLLVCRRCPP